MSFDCSVCDLDEATNYPSVGSSYVFAYFYNLFLFLLTIIDDRVWRDGVTDCGKFSVLACILFAHISSGLSIVGTCIVLGFNALAIVAGAVFVAGASVRGVSCGQLALLFFAQPRTATTP